MRIKYTDDVVMVCEAIGFMEHRRQRESEKLQPHQISAVKQAKVKLIVEPRYIAEYV